MILYDYFRSSACYRVRIALNLKQISYQKIPIHLTQDGGAQHTPQYQQINPQQLVPTLDENGHILGQSLAIIEYLEELYPTPALLPKTPLLRAHIRELATTIACDVHPLNNLRVLDYLRKQQALDDAQIQAWYHHWLKLGLDAFEQRLQKLQRKNPVCSGDDVTLADICLIPQVYNAHRFQFSMDNYPIINEIYAYCTQLSAFQNAAPRET
mgnify:CR=1 FL=1